jgi:hypothetical protein
MKDRNALAGLIGELDKHRAVLGRMAEFLSGFKQKHHLLGPAGTIL